MPMAPYSGQYPQPDILTDVPRQIRRPPRGELLRGRERIRVLPVHPSQPRSMGNAENSGQANRPEPTDGPGSLTIMPAISGARELAALVMRRAWSEFDSQSELELPWIPVNRRHSPETRAV